MKRLTPLFRRVAAASVSVAAALALAGCPLPDGGQNNTAKLTMLLAAGDDAFTATKDLGTKARVVQQAEIESLFVNLDQIQLRRTTVEGSELITVFSDPLQINLLDLVGVKDVIDAAVVPEGTYTEVIMQLSAPRLTLAADPATVIEAIALPDGGSLSVAADFSATDNGAGLLVLQLGSISLVSLDDGTYQLVPDLQVDLFDSAIEARANGVISAVDPATNTIVVRRDSAQITVDVSGADIFKPSDFDAPTGTIADLLIGLRVFASGNLSVDGELLADIVVIFPGAPANVNRQSFEIRLNGVDAEAGAEGEAEYETEGDRRKFKVESDDLSTPGLVDIYVDGVYVGSGEVRRDDDDDDKDDDGNELEFRLDTRLGEEVPEVTRESLIEVLAGGTDVVLLSSAAPALPGDDDDDDDNGSDDDGDDNGGDDDGSDDDGDDNGGDDNGSDDDGDDNGGDDNGSDDDGSDDDGSDDDGSDDDGSDDDGSDDDGDDNGSDDDGDDNGGDDNGSDDVGDDNGGDDNGGDDNGSDDDSDDNSGDDDDSDDNDDDDDKI